MNEVHAVKCKDVLNMIPRLLEKHYNEQIADVWRFGINTALRISDLLSIKLSDIEQHNDSHQVRLVEQKTGKAAEVYLNDSAMAIVRKIRTIHPDNVYLFQSYSKNQKKIKPITRQAVSGAFKEVGNIVGVSINTHSMRKTRGYHIYQNTKNIALVMKMLRHSSEAHTMRYIGIERGDMINLANDFNL